MVFSLLILIHCIIFFDFLIQILTRTYFCLNAREATVTPRGCGDSGNHLALFKSQVVELLQAKMHFLLAKFLRARQKGDSMKSLFKTVALITFFSILTRIAGFFFRIYLSRVIGAESLGMYQVASSIFMVLLTVVSSGIPLIISRMGAGFRAKINLRKNPHSQQQRLFLRLLFQLFFA